MRISDWSADVCSSDLLGIPAEARHGVAPGGGVVFDAAEEVGAIGGRQRLAVWEEVEPQGDVAVAPVAGGGDQPRLRKDGAPGGELALVVGVLDRKSTRLNSSH